MPRQTEFSQGVADQICERLADGESLRSICDAEDLPAKSTVFKWLNEQPTFSDQYARARETQADSLFDEILSIADDGHNDFMLKKFGEDERWVENGEALRRSQLRVDARKWMAGKLKPKKYAEKITAEHTGADGGAIKTEDIGMTEVGRRVAFLLASAVKAKGGE